MRKSEIRSHRWPLTSGRGSLELCIEEERVTVNVDNVGLRSIKPENLELLIIEPLNRVNSRG